MPNLSVTRFHSPSSSPAGFGRSTRSLPYSLWLPGASGRVAGRGSLRFLVALLAVMASLLGLSGCGGGWGEFKPTITTQVQSLTVTVGATAKFTVVATGTGPLTYQWFENGAAIAGATGTSYSMTAQASDNGAVMSAVATNAGGSSSSQGTLTVQIPPAITTQPASVTVATGQTATFSVVASGTGPLTYQWLQGGVPISGATSSTYTTAAATSTGSSSLTVVVSNMVGHATSAPATLTVDAVPVLAFAPISTQTFGTAAFPVSASSASNGSIAYAVTSGPATISGNTVTMTGVGTVVLSASQAATGTYGAATATTSFVVNPEVPTLQFAAIPSVAVGTPFTVSASSASNGAVTYSVISGPAKVSGATVTVTGPGTVVLGASQAASGNYASATATTTVVPGAQTPNLAFAPISSQNVGAAPFPVSATSVSPGAVTYAVVSGPATISGNTVTVTGAGTVVLSASQAAAGGYNAATATTSFPVVAPAASLAFAPIAPQTFGNAPFPVSATSASPGAVTYAVASGPATISGNTVSLTGVGTVALTATQAASGSYSALTANTSFTVAPATPALAFAPIPAQTAGGAPFTVSATSASSGPVTYAVVSGPATISGNTVSVTGSGTVVLSATQAASGNYGSATASTNFTAGAPATTLAFAPIANQTYGNAPFPVSATSASPGAVTYTVVSGPATISGNTVTINGMGAVALSASQVASGSYPSATASTSFIVAPATPTLSFAPIPAQTAGGAPFPVSATSASSGAVTYAVVSGPATIAGNTVTTTGTGTVVLSASQAAAGDYTAATASTSFTVGAQSAALAFAPIPAQTYGNAPFTVSATSASPAPVQYTVTSGPATISGNTVTITGTGAVTLTATQAASGSYAASAPATATFTVAAATPNLQFAPIPPHSVGDAPFPVTASSASSGTVTYSVVSGPATIVGNLVTLTGSGNVVLAASQAAAGNYTAATTNVTIAAGSLTATLSFAPIGTHSFGDAPFPVTASSASNGAVTYNVISGPATVSGNVVTLTGAGTVVLGASQAAAGGYLAANATTSFSAGAEVPNLTFAPIATQTYGGAPITVSATSASNGLVAYAVVSGPATVSGSTVTTTGVGTVILSASQAASGSFAPATVTTDFNVIAATPTLSFAPIPAHTYGDAPFMVSASSASSGAITYSVVSGPATVSGSTVTLTGNGQVVLSANQAASGDYATATAQTSFAVATETPTLTFAAIPQHTYGDAPFTVSATSASSGPVVYAVQSGPATISGNTVTITGTGTVTLTANQAASGSYAAAAQATTSFTVVPAKPTLTFASIPPQTFGGAPFNISASSASTGPITYSIVSGPATISGQTVTVTSNGSIVIGASQAADANYTATSTTTIVNVGIATPNLQFAPIAAQTYGNAPFMISASSASTGAVTYAVQSGPATLSGNTVTITGAGTIVLTANQAQAPGYGAASTNASVSVSAESTTLAFTPFPNHTYGDAPFTVSASSASNGAITYGVVSGPATISGNTVSITGTGNVVLSASQAATTNYAAASTTTNFSVSTGAPTLTFAAIPAHTYGDAPFTVNASSASNGAITYGVVSGPATISGNTVTLTGSGNVVLSASQAATTNYAAASASANFNVGTETPTLTFAAIPAHTYGDPAFAVSATSASSGPVVYAVQSGPATISGNMVTVNGTGTVVLTANQAAYGSYGAAAQATASFAVNPETPALAFAAIPNHTYGDPNFPVTASSASAGAITYSVQSGPASIVNGNNVQITGTGSVMLLATQAAAGNYASATATASFTVNAEATPITFTVANQTYSTTPFTVTASSSSPGAFTYSYVSGPVTLSGNTVTMTGVGTAKLSVSQAASGDYAAGTATATFTITQATPTISFSIPNQTYGGAPVTLSASSPSTGAFTYTVVSGPATISNGMLQTTGVGTVKVSVSQAADPNYTAASATATFTVSAASPTISFSVPNQSFSTTPFAVNATSNSAGAFTYSVGSGPATISGNSVTMTGSGAVVLLASQAANGDYTAGTQTASFTIAAVAPTLTFNVPNQTYSSTPFTVNAASNSSGAITYSVLSGPATVSGNSVTLTGLGTVQLQASQAANGGYAAATATATFTVGGQVPTITFSVPNQTYSSTPFPVSASSNSPGAFTYSITSGPASVSGNSVTMGGVGTVNITVNQAASGTWAAGSASTSFTVAPGSPSINFSIPDQTYGPQTIALSATSNSTGAFTYTIVSGPATVSPNGSLKLTGTGAVQVTASEAAAGNYAAGTATATFNVNPANPGIVFSVPNQPFSVTPIQLNATSSSAGAFTYSVQSGPAVMSGANSVTLTGSGTVVLVASQAANGNYTAASQTASFTVSAITPTLTFNVQNQTYGVAPFTVSATSNSQGAITYSYVSGPATLTSPNTVTITGVGTVQLLASQAANGGYSAATATTTFTVAGQAPTVTFSVPNQTYSSTAFPVNASSNSPGAFSYVINSGPATVTGNNVTMTGVGTVSITANQAASGTWAAGSATTTFTIAAATPAINFVVPNQTYGAAPFTVSASSPSSGAFTYTVVSGPATVSGNTVTLTGAGMVTLKATQAAAGNYTTNSATASFNVAQNVSISPITPANQTSAPGQITFNATATGGDTDNLTWSASGGSFSGSTWTSPTTAGTYTITATSADDTTKSVSTTAVISAPVITKQPVSANLCVGSQATLSVTANYANTYQWLLNGTAIQGATFSSYYIASAQTSNAGTYTVQVSNPAGTVLSNIATVGVGSSITNNPNNVTTYPTQTATFSVGVTGDGPFSYQWYQIPSGSTVGTAISGATNVSYTTPAVSSANNGTRFYVIVTDTCGTTMQSTSADLTVISGNAPPTITQQPSNVTTPIGGTPSFSVVATGTGLSYQWYQIPAGSAQGTKVLVTNATSATYTLPATSTTASNDQDQYYVVVKNSYGQAVSFPATLTVGAGISITQQPQSVYINPGQSATFSVTATSTAPLMYQWYEAAPGSSTFNAIAGATSSSYTFASAAQTNSNTVFYVVVSNGGASHTVTSTSAAMFVTPLQGIPLCSQNWNTVGSTVAVNPKVSPDANTYGQNCAWELTNSGKNEEGNIVWPTLISTGNIQLQFTVAVSNPSNPAADGFTLLLGDPSLGATPTSQGMTGQGMGAEDIPGFVLAFDTYNNPGDPPVPYLGVGRGETALWENPYTYTNTTIPALATQGSTVTHNYLVSIVQGYMTVSMDNNQVFSGQVSVPPVAYLYFTSSTGTYDETAVVSNVQATVSVP